MTLLQRLTDILAAAALALTILVGILLAHALDGPSTSERPAGAGISLPAPAANRNIEDI